MTLIGLTGGIASGKSTIGRRLEALGAVHIDADQLAREVVAPGSPALDEIRVRFGEGVLDSTGQLDRQKLGSLVFADAEGLAALNAITHPAVRALADSRMSAARLANPGAVIVYEVPLLVEAKVDMGWDVVVVADTPAADRVERLIDLRGMSREEAERRVANQASDAERRAAADVVIDTSGTEAETLRQVDQLWAMVRAMPARTQRASSTETVPRLRSEGS